MGHIDRDVEPESNPDEFADHFEWDGPRWLYFRDGWKAPVPVSPEERDRAVAWHENSVLATVGLAMVTAVLLFFVPWQWLDAVPKGVQQAIVAVLMFAILGASWTALERWIVSPFAGRHPVGPPRDRRLLARRRLARTSWTRLFVTIAASSALAVLWFVWSPGTDWLIWLVPLSMALTQVYQKWRLERRPASLSP